MQGIEGGGAGALWFVNCTSSTTVLLRLNLFPRARSIFKHSPVYTWLWAVENTRKKYFSSSLRSGSALKGIHSDRPSTEDLS